VHISIDGHGRVGMTDAAEFTAFDIHAVDPSVESVLGALGSDGWPSPEADHVFVTIDAVRRLAGDEVDEAWQTSFDAMLAYAGSKGWLDEARTAIKAHIESV
jgi:hypothetical protein